MGYNIKQYLDATFLKTAEQSYLTINEYLEIINSFIDESILEGFKLVMLRPEYVSLAKNKITKCNSNLLVGTVIDFPNGQGTIEAKIAEAKLAIQNGADELDFVIDYERYKLGDVGYIQQQVLQCSKFVLDNNKVIKWIIETASLNDTQIIQLTVLIKNVILSNFKENQYDKVFVKSSTGFYETSNGLPNGATLPIIKLMLENSFPLSVKASGGIKDINDALKMIKLGVKRIGTSSAKEIANGFPSNSDY